ESGGDGVAHPTEVRGPAAVLVDSEEAAGFLGDADEALALGEVRDEGFLAQDVLAGAQGLLDEIGAAFGMGRDVDDGDVRAFEEFAAVRMRSGVGIEAVALLGGLRRVAVAE